MVWILAVLSRARGKKSGGGLWVCDRIDEVFSTVEPVSSEYRTKEV